MELIIVLVLVATVLGIVAPSLRGFARGRTDADAARSVLAMTHLARSIAATSGTPVRVNVDSEAGLCWVTVQQAGAFVELTTDIGRRIELPKGTTVEIELPAGKEPRNYVNFLPDGRTEQAVISLTNRNGEAWHVSCLSATDRFRIVKPWEDGR